MRVKAHFQLLKQLELPFHNIQLIALLQVILLSSWSSAQWCGSRFKCKFYFLLSMLLACSVCVYLLY